MSNEIRWAVVVVEREGKIIPFDWLSMLLFCFSKIISKWMYYGDAELVTLLTYDYGFRGFVRWEATLNATKKMCVGMRGFWTTER